jgi:hypothetical protein
MVRQRRDVALKDPVELYDGRSGNRLPDLAAAISELRHSAMPCDPPRCVANKLQALL